MPCKYGSVFALYLHDWTLYGINTVKKTGPYLHGVFPVNDCISKPPKQLIKALKYSESIVALNLGNLNLVSEGLVSELASSIKTWTSLEKVYLCNNNLSLSVTVLTKTLATISALKV